MKKLLTLTLITALALGFSACDKDPDEVTPTAQAELNRAIVYSYEQPQSFLVKLYGEGSTETYASYDTEHFGISIGAPLNVGKDNITFVISEEDLKSNLSGAYTLKTLPDVSEGQVDVTYSYLRDAHTRSIITSDKSNIEGHFTISAHDTKRHLVSGTYELVIPNAYDPTVDQFTEPNLRRCDISISGSFTNVKVIQE
ncbi:hypothetical protein POKO110462_10105 [Pontibacter korlensis]|uniref:DUF1735 domain-containing protein n=1 Tax=Pontibacter korlensis TaxID=400092 RepID=A0A0E3UYW2_9BACT|nr:hypothetical protein [Pontibacter korlensis]AKD04791.1 hypothetical protein PKOR_18935 [Pontibacter korlensis]